MISSGITLVGKSHEVLRFDIVCQEFSMHMIDMIDL